MTDKMTARQEAEAMLELYDGRLSEALKTIERQLDVLYTRGQVLVSLAGVTVTVTGFSGRNIAATGPLAQGLVVAGLAVVLGSAFLVFLRVMRIQWVTRELGPDPATTLETVIARRDSKTSAIIAGGFLLFLGLALYLAAVSLMLVHVR